MSKSRSKESPAALEIPTDVGRARFGLGHLSDPEEGLPLLVRMGLWGFGKENLNQITEESGQPVPEAFLALHRRRLKKQNLLTYTMDVGFAPDCIEYWVFHNPSLETGCVVGFDFKGVARNDAEII